tara:strand:+ start:120 stop:311 length:192 start_codon:yes stop_codon:yes gene_type:complete
MLDKKLLEILACPICKGELHYDKNARELVCAVDKLAFPIRDGVPVMLTAEARAMSSDELESLR